MVQRGLRVSVISPIELVNASASRVLERLGANLRTDGHTAIVAGPADLTGCTVMATDLRASAGYRRHMLGSLLRRLGARMQPGAGPALADLAPIDAGARP